MATYNRYGDGREREGVAEDIADVEPRHPGSSGFNSLAGFAERSRVVGNHQGGYQQNSIAESKWQVSSTRCAGFFALLYGCKRSRALEVSWKAEAGGRGRVGSLRGWRSQCCLQ
jgi:hypothetical protein